MRSNYSDKELLSILKRGSSLTPSSLSPIEKEEYPNDFALFMDQIRDYYLQGSSVIYYQHKARKKDPYYIDQHKRLLEDPAFTGAKGLILKFKKTSLRYYCFIIQPDHQDAITEAVNMMLETAWGEHFAIL